MSYTYSNKFNFRDEFRKAFEEANPDNKAVKRVDSAEFYMHFFAAVWGSLMIVF